jgi:hypothetical protein
MAVYDDPEQAKRAVEELRRFDFRDEEVGLAVSRRLRVTRRARRRRPTLRSPERRRERSSAASSARSRRERFRP